MSDRSNHKSSNVRTTKRVVRPRRFVNDTRPLIAVSWEEILIERTGELLPISELPTIVATEPPSIVICENASKMVKQLDHHFGEMPAWQFKMTPVIRRKYREHKKPGKPMEVLETVVAFFGFRAPNGKSQNRYHMPLDPISFIGGKGIRGIIDADIEPSKVRALMLWGFDVREWCQSQLIKVTTRNGGIAAALLKDPRFYPDARRKVPRATNDRARDHLPGNHYELYVPERTYHDAYYVDMTAAHHNAATSITFPDANRLFARGKYKNPPTTVERGVRVWAKRDSDMYRNLIKTHGLFLLRVSLKRIPPKAYATVFPPPYLKDPKQQLIYVYSNELDLLASHDVYVEGIEAAWTSSATDTGLNKYAEWALSEVESMSSTRKSWGKPTLLATYGMLAARPNHIEFGFKHSSKGEDRIYMTSGGPLTVRALRTSREIESTTVNVIHRGMIEAEIRKQALMYSRELVAQGVKVLAIYADSIIIDSTGSIPFIREPWRIKSPLSHLTFFNPVSFDSEEITRLPGIPREGLDRLHRLQMIRNVSARPHRTPGQAAVMLLTGRKHRRGKYRRVGGMSVKR